MPDNLSKLVVLMKKHDLTRQKVADLLFIKKSTVDHWFKLGTGKRSLPVGRVQALVERLKRYKRV